METFPNTEHLIGLLPVILVIFLAARAWTHGVLKMFWAIIGLGLGAAVGFFFFQNANALLSRVLPGRELGFNAVVGGSIAIALISYLVFRQLSKAILQKIFNPEGILSGWSEGFRGSLLSLIPSVITVLVVGLALRMGGTLMELRAAERNCHPDMDYLKNVYPGWSVVTDWRNAAERLPYVLDIYHPIDPISRPAERQLVLLLITTKKKALFTHLEQHDETSQIIAGPIFQALMKDPTVVKLLEERNHTALLRHPEVVTAASNNVLAQRISAIDLPPIIDAFMLSEERQKLLQSYKRPEVPAF
jgi:hypothetical protein